MSAWTSPILSEAMHGFLHFVQENAETLSLRSHDYLLLFHCCNPTIKRPTVIYTHMVLYVVNFTISGTSGTKGMPDIALFRILGRHT